MYKTDISAVLMQKKFKHWLNIIGIGQRKLTHVAVVPIGLCTKFGELHPELRIFLNFSLVINLIYFVGCSNVYL